jgi:thymidylate synthase
MNTTPEKHPEHEYLNALRQIMEKGERRNTRNGMTRSIFGMRMEFPLYRMENGIETAQMPLMTTKKVFWKGVVHELLWFLRGDTNAKNLDKMGVKIWNENSSRATLDALGLTEYEEGDCGPVYGYQWRHFGARYGGPGSGGIDQLENCIQLLRNDPYSRRIFMSAWNPMDLEAMCLPPCHVSYQFYVSSSEKRLYCQLYQRSADMFLGVPFNIASVSLLTHLLADLVGLKPGGVILVLGDAHIYEDHMGVVSQQLERIPVAPFPSIRIIGGVQNSCEGGYENIEQYRFEDIILEDYVCESALKASMAV